MRELPEPKITPVLLDEFRQALAGGRGDLDAWLEVNDEAEVRAFVLAIQKQAYEDGLRDADTRYFAVPMDKFEQAIREVGVVSACEWFGHAPDSEFTLDTIKVLAEREAMLTASKKEPQ